MWLVLRILVNAVAIWIAANVVPGIRVGGMGPTLIAALVLGAINAVVRPVLVFLTFPITLVTLGLFLLVLNAFCLWLTSKLVPGFVVQGFWAALLGSLLISVVSWILNAFIGHGGAPIRRF
ncbi:MAG: phage holin family protein [Candidatus Rokubacteria bacterium]|nr:phage holin family protein [Candidatus Rokubacteria bacterium]MBI3827079.1 phage holin family protein [Candidatus Rokubacteria bacterium]